MAAYAALVSLMHIIEKIQHHPRPPFYLDNIYAQCLIEKLTFLQKFLEDYSHFSKEEVDHLESRIAEAAYAAEDLIETHVVDQILAQSARHGKRICSVGFYQDLQKVTQDIDFIKNEVMEIKDKMGSVKNFQQYRRSLTPSADSSRSPPPGQKNMVGCDDILEHIVDKLTRQWPSKRQLIPIVGMGGIGKTTLAKNVYESKLILQHFDVRAWATLSQEYIVQKILLELLLCLNSQDSQECLSGKNEMELKDILHKSLCGRRYLIILDDMWSIEAWDKVKSSFPGNDNGSRVIITTRQSNVALDLTGGCRDDIIDMKFLDGDISWNLLCNIVFGSEDYCPPELKKIGRKIVKNCRGLPLAIVVIGGLLAKSEKTLEYWEYIAENLHSLEENEHCLNLLYTSYNHLPVHLKPCFLYMGIFAEDCTIDVRTLSSLWVDEGFLKPISHKRLEEVATEYLKDLVDRNLVIAEKRNHNGEIRICKIHDLLRDLCLKESQKDKFLLVRSPPSFNNSPQGINTQRRVAIYLYTPEKENQCYFPQLHDALQSALLVRTLLFDIDSASLAHALLCDTESASLNQYLASGSPNFRLLRILTSAESCVFRLVNLRFIAAAKQTRKLNTSFLPSSTHLFWNLQTLFLGEPPTIKKSFELWKMPLLRAVYVYQLYLTNPSQDDFILGNLHTLMYVANFRCSGKVANKIPNIKVLKISYDKRFIGSRYCLNNLACLHKLEQFNCKFLEKVCRSELAQNLMFPNSLKELSLRGSRLHWEDILTKIGSLPLLQVLKLQDEAVLGPEWETIDGQFSSLKILKISKCGDLKCWKTDDTHFPCLEQLVLEGLGELEEIPSAIGDIPTLRLIKLADCCHPAVISAKKIAEEQEELENPDLHVRVEVDCEEYERMKTLTSPNFEVVKY